MPTTWPITASQWIFGNQSLEDTVARLSRTEYDGIELAGEPGRIDVAACSTLLSDAGLSAPSVCGLYTQERDLSHPDAKRRREAEDYVLRCVELQAQFGPGVVIVVPTAVGRTAPLASRAAELDNAREALTRIGDRLSGTGVRIVVESLNRYETYLINHLTDAYALACSTGCADIGVMLDTFHMGIEEPDVGEVLHSVADRLWHVHLADSNRRPVGQGHIDLHTVVTALADVKYEGSLCMEHLPASGDPYDQDSLNVSEREQLSNMRAPIGHLRSVLAAGIQ